MKVLFLHVPKFNNTYKPIGDFIWLNYMPMGLMALAARAAAKGYECEIVHQGVEWALDRSFRVEELVNGDPDIAAVGLTLHWHHQSYDAIEVARAIKAVRPDIFVFVGGDTASFFHEEIIRDFPMIDAVVRGHAEKPLLALLAAVEEGGLRGNPENITFRRQEQIVTGELGYRGDADETDDLDYTAFHLIRHRETYIRDFGLPFFHAKRFSLEQNHRMFSLGSPMFPVPIGRGCPFVCTWCAGSHRCQMRHISGMKGFFYRSHDRVIDSVTRACDAGYGIMQSAMDPEPDSPDYFIELWHRLGQHSLPVSWLFECNGLPTTEFLNAFKKTFNDPRSLVVISPECGNEKLRLAHKGPGFTNDALMGKLAEMDRLGVGAELFFTYGLPGGNMRGLMETVHLQRTLLRRFKCVRAIRTLSVEMEPGAPWQLEPERYNIVTNRRTFRDFYSAHADNTGGTFSDFGYYIPDYFDRPLDRSDPFTDFARRMQALKCRYLCNIHPNPAKCGRQPWQGRLFCRLASRLIRLKPQDRSKPYGEAAA